MGDVVCAADSRRGKNTHDEYQSPRLPNELGLDFKTMAGSEDGADQSTYRECGAKRNNSS